MEVDGPFYEGEWEEVSGKKYRGLCVLFHACLFRLCACFPSVYNLCACFPSVYTIFTYGNGGSFGAEGASAGPTTLITPDLTCNQGVRMPYEPSDFSSPSYLLLSASISPAF